MTCGFEVPLVCGGLKDGAKSCNDKSYKVDLHARVKNYT